MSVESASYINQLDPTNPNGSSLKSEGDNQIRLLKTVLQTSFPGVSGAVTATHVELNHVDGVTSAIQTQLDAKAPIASPAFTGTPTAPTASTATSTTQVASTAFVHAVLDDLGDATIAEATTQAGLADTARIAAQAAQAAAEAVVATIPEGTINDATTSTGSVWSSSKVSTELSGKASTAAVAAKQDTLVSGTNIKTVGGASLLGSGDVPITASGYSLIDTIAVGTGVTEIIKTGLPACSRFYVALHGVTFAAAPTNVWFFISDDGGSTWSTETPSVGNQNPQTAMLEILGGHLSGQPKLRVHSSTGGYVQNGVITSVTGVVNAIKFSAQSGTTFYGAGTIYIYGMA